MNKKSKIILIVAIVAVVAAFVLAGVMRSSDPDTPSVTDPDNGGLVQKPDKPNTDPLPEIDLSQFIVIDGVTGANGQGMLTYSFDKQAFFAYMMDGLNEEDFPEEDKEGYMTEQMNRMTEIDNALKCITVQASKETGLRNNDVVTVTALFANTKGYEFGHTFKDGEKSYTVSHLLEGKRIDPFSEEYVSVSFSGVNGQGTAQLKVLTVESPVYLFTYKLSRQAFLWNGTTIKLTVSVDEEALLELGYYLPDNLEKEITVTGLSEYITDPQKVPADALPSLISRAMEGSAAQEAYDKEFGYQITKTSAVDAAFFLTAKDPANPGRDSNAGYLRHNVLIIVTHFSYEYEGEQKNQWMIWIFPNYILDPEGNFVSTEESSGCRVMGGESLENVMDWLRREYDDMDITQLQLP